MKVSCVKVSCGAGIGDIEKRNEILVELAHEVKNFSLKVFKTYFILSFWWFVHSEIKQWER